MAWEAADTTGLFEKQWRKVKKQQRVGVWKRDVEEVKEVTSSTSVK